MKKGLRIAKVTEELSQNEQSNESGSVELTDEQQQKKAREELRKLVIAEQLAQDPILSYVEELTEYKVVDPLSFEGVHGQPEEWTNIPKLIARFLIRNQQHLIALVQYLHGRSFEETSMDLRAFAEQNFDVSYRLSVNPGSRNITRQ